MVKIEVDLVRRLEHGPQNVRLAALALLERVSTGALLDPSRASVLAAVDRLYQNLPNPLDLGLGETFDQKLRARGRAGYEAISVLLLVAAVDRVWADDLDGLRALANEVRDLAPGRHRFSEQILSALCIHGEGALDPGMVDTIRRVCHSDREG